MSTFISVLIIIGFVWLDTKLIIGLVKKIQANKKKKEKTVEIAQDLVDINNDKKED